MRFMHKVFSVLPSEIFFPTILLGGLPETASYSLEKSNSSPLTQHGGLSDKIFLSADSGTIHKTCFWLKISKSVRTLNPSGLTFWENFRRGR